MQPGTHLLTGGDGVRYPFDPGALCLELLLTGGPGGYARWEVLHRPADLAGFVGGCRLAAVAPLPVHDLRIGAGDLTAVRRLRDALWHVVPAVAAGRRPDPGYLDVVNGCTADAPRPRLDPATLHRGWVTPVTGGELLGAFARDAVDLFSRPAGRLRECAADDCHLPFLDTSRPGNRRWCAMQRCGNRNKVRGHRARHGPGGGPAAGR